MREDVRRSDDSIGTKLEDWVDEAYESLPDEIKQLEDFPSIEVLNEPPVGLVQERKLPDNVEILGLFIGVPRTMRRHNMNSGGPTVIHIYRGPLERIAKGEQLRNLVKKTVWHEVAHWLGHPERDMEALGL